MEFSNLISKAYFVVRAKILLSVEHQQSAESRAAELLSRIACSQLLLCGSTEFYLQNLSNILPARVTLTPAT